MKTNLLKLHDSDDNSVIVINSEKITVFQAEQTENKKYTTIYLKGDDIINNLTVNETVEKICQMLDNNKLSFIKLHDSDNNSVIGINLNYIILIQTCIDKESNKRYSTIYINDNIINNISVNEAPERIYQAIIEK